MRLGAGVIALSILVATTASAGTLTHTSYSVTSSDRAAIVQAMTKLLKVKGIEVQGLKGSESLTTGAIAVCGYVTGLTASGVRTKPAIFGGQFSTVQRSLFHPFGDGGGKGASADRIKVVKTICDANGIGM